MTDSSYQWVVRGAVLVLLTVLTLLAFGGSARERSPARLAYLESVAAHEQQVRAFIAAFNAGELDRIASGREGAMVERRGEEG